LKINPAGSLPIPFQKDVFMTCFWCGYHLGPPSVCPVCGREVEDFSRYQKPIDLTIVKASVVDEYLIIQTGDNLELPFKLSPNISIKVG
jgi:hypothetical protein